MGGTCYLLQGPWCILQLLSHHNLMSRVSYWLHKGCPPAWQLPPWLPQPVANALLCAVPHPVLLHQSDCCLAAVFPSLVAPAVALLFAPSALECPYSWVCLSLTLCLIHSAA